VSLRDLDPVFSNDREDSVIDVISYSLLIEIIIGSERFALDLNRLAI
jgi:hypothetical protein